MASNSLARFLVIVLLFACSAAAVHGWPHKQGQKARVHFLATSTLIRSTWGGNQDAYLAELQDASGNDPFLVRIVDDYPSDAPAISRGGLTSQSGIELRLKRDTQCDMPFASMALRSAPGDPHALLREKLAYRPVVREAPSSNAMLPCYRTVR